MAEESKEQAEAPVQEQAAPQGPTQAELIEGSMNATAECRSLLRAGFFPGTKGAKLAGCIRFLDALYDQQKSHLKTLSKQK